MRQLEMFDAATVACPGCVCPYEAPCHKAGRAVLGPVERIEEDGECCEQRSVTCLSCGRVGTLSANLALVKA